jgi:hypothetical protein
MHLSVILVIAAMRKMGTINSDGTTASCPYTNMNGVCHVKLLHVVLHAHNTTSIFKSQSSMLTLQMLVKSFSKILLNVSIVPFS